MFMIYFNDEQHISKVVNPLGAHAQRGLQYLVCVLRYVYVFVC